MLNGQSKRQLDSLENELNKSKDTVQQLKIIGLLNWAYFNTNPNRVCEFALKGFRIALKTGNRKEQIRNMMFMAQAQKNIGQYSKSFVLFKEAYKFSRILKDSIFQLNSLISFGNYYFETKNYDDAIAALEDASVLIGSHIDWEENLTLKYNLATFYIEKAKSMKDPMLLKQGIVNFEKLKNFAILRHDTEYVTSSCCAIAKSYVQLYDIIKQESSLKKAQEQTEFVKHYLRHSPFCFNLGLSYSYSGIICHLLHNDSEARRHFLQEEKILLAIDNQNDIIERYNLLCDSYTTIYDYKKALYFADKIKVIASNALMAEYVCDNYLTLANLYMKLQDIDKSLYYQKRYSHISDSLVKENNVRLAEQLNAQISYEKIIHEIEKVDKLINIKTDDEWRVLNNSMTYFIAGGVLLIFSIFLLIIYNKRKLE